MKILSRIFYIIALVLSHTMVGVVCYNYASMEFGIIYMAYSAPASVAYFLAIPFLIAIAINLFLGWLCGRKDKNNGKNNE